MQSSLTVTREPVHKSHPVTPQQMVRYCNSAAHPAAHTCRCMRMSIMLSWKFTCLFHLLHLQWSQLPCADHQNYGSHCKVRAGGHVPDQLVQVPQTQHPQAHRNLTFSNSSCVYNNSSCHIHSCTSLSRRMSPLRRLPAIHSSTGGPRCINDLFICQGAAQLA